MPSEPVTPAQKLDGAPIHEVLVCKGPECGDKRFAGDIAAQFRKLIKARGLESRIKLDRYCCFGKCQSGPNVATRVVEPGAAPFYLAPGRGVRLHLGVTPGDVPRILEGLSDRPAAAEEPPAAASATLAPPSRSRDDGHS